MFPSIVVSVCLLSLTNTLLVPSNLAYAKTPCHFPAIINLGDSNSDTGGYSAAFGQAPPPYGESFFHGPAGRFCDGRLIIDFMAESLGLPYLNAFLDALRPNYTHGVNFATASAPIRLQNMSGYSPFTLDVQFTQFNDFHRRSQIIRNHGGISRGLLPNSEDFSRALYTIDIGQNDLTAGLFQNWSTDQVKASIPDMLAPVATVVRELYGLGGRSFWIHNTGPVGCLPYVIENVPMMAGQMDKIGCLAPANEICQYFNTELKELVAQLRKELPMAAITYVDIYSVKYALYSQPTKYGFMDTLRACCGYEGEYNYNSSIGCGGKINVDGKQVVVGKACDDPSVMINWDGIHYTQAANKFVFHQIVGGSFSDPPLSLNRACYSKLR